MNVTTGIVGWTSEPEGRGTWGLLWSCFATIFLCTWSALHLNVPTQEYSDSRILGRRVIQVVGCLVAPEYYAIDAIMQFADARALQARTPKWSLKKCFLLVMKGFIIEYDLDSQTHRNRLDPKALYKLMEEGTITWLDIDDAEIDDRSKADHLVKLLALTQILWFVTQIIGRLVQKLAITTLELFTLGIVTWAVIIYGVYWEKPFDIRHPVVVRVKVKQDFTARENVLRRVPVADYGAGPGIAHERMYVLICAVVSLAFSALHVAAWKFHFSTLTELWLWRTNSILCTVAPLLLALLFCLLPEPQDVPDINSKHWWFPGLLAVLYTIGRLYMFVEMFAGLRAAPASVYQTPQWSQYFPSIG